MKRLSLCGPSVTDRSPDGGTSLLVPSYVSKLAPPGSETPPNKVATESSRREPWPANAGALSVKGNEARPRVIRQNKNPARIPKGGVSGTLIVSTVRSAKITDDFGALNEGSA
jgi:hypothetical protein